MSLPPKKISDKNSISVHLFTFYSNLYIVQILTSTSTLNLLHSVVLV